METNVSVSDNLSGMAKTEKTVPIYARLTETDVAAVDKAAAKQPIAVSRSHMIALIVREWVSKQRPPRK